jgi:hypothetical protein
LPSHQVFFKGFFHSYSYGIP